MRLQIFSVCVENTQQLYDITHSVVNLHHLKCHRSVSTGNTLFLLCFTHHSHLRHCLHVVCTLPLADGMLSVDEGIVASTYGGRAMNRNEDQWICVHRWPAQSLYFFANRNPTWTRSWRYWQYCFMILFYIYELLSNLLGSQCYMLFQAIG